MLDVLPTTTVTISRLVDWLRMCSLAYEEARLGTDKLMLYLLY